MSFLQFGGQLPTPVGVVPIPKGEQRVVDTDPCHQREKGLVPIPTPQGEIMLSILTLWKASSGLLLLTGSPKVTQKTRLAMLCVLPLGKQKLMLPR